MYRTNQEIKAGRMAIKMSSGQRSMCFVDHLQQEGRCSGRIVFGLCVFGGGGEGRGTGQLLHCVLYGPESPLPAGCFRSILRSTACSRRSEYCSSRASVFSSSKPSTPAGGRPACLDLWPGPWADSSGPVAGCWRQSSSFLTEENVS